MPMIRAGHLGQARPRLPAGPFAPVVQDLAGHAVKGLYDENLLPVEQRPPKFASKGVLLPSPYGKLIYKFCGMR